MHKRERAAHRATSETSACEAKTLTSVEMLHLNGTQGASQTMHLGPRIVRKGVPDYIDCLTVSVKGVKKGKGIRGRLARGGCQICSVIPSIRYTCIRCAVTMQESWGLLCT